MLTFSVDGLPARAVGVGRVVRGENLWGVLFIFTVTRCADQRGDPQICSRGTLEQ